MLICFRYESENLGFPLTVEAARYLDKRSLSFTSDIGALRQLITGHDVAGPIDDAVNLLEQLLTINPVYRCSAESALQSLFLRGADILCDYSKDYLHRPSIDDFDFEQEK